LRVSSFPGLAPDEPQEQTSVKETAAKHTGPYGQTLPPRRPEPDHVFRNNSTKSEQLFVLNVTMFPLNANKHRETELEDFLGQVSF